MTNKNKIKNPAKKGWSVLKLHSLTLTIPELHKERKNTTVLSHENTIIGIKGFTE